MLSSESSNSVDEENFEYLLSHDRYVVWDHQPKPPLPVLCRFLSREGALITRNLVLCFSESSARDPSRRIQHDITISNFLTQYSGWFEKLIIDELLHDLENNLQTSRERLQEIIDTSRITTVELATRSPIPLLPLIQRPHVRRVTIGLAFIDRETVEILNRIGNQYEEIVLADCLFDDGIIELFHDIPLKITGYICFVSSRDSKYLSTSPFISAFRWIQYEEASEVLSRISVNTNITKLEVIRATYGSWTLVPTLARMTQLRNLTLQTISITDTELKALTTLTNLRSLSLSRQRSGPDSLGDHPIEILFHFPHLRKLELLNVTEMTSERCDLLAHRCPRLQSFRYYYNEVSNEIKLYTIIRSLSQGMRDLRYLRVSQRSDGYSGSVNASLLRKLMECPPHALENVIVGTDSGGGIDLLSERHQMMKPECNRYLYNVFVIVRSWNQRVGSLCILPKDVVDLILTEHIKLFGRSPLKIKRLVEFIWTHWRQMEELIHCKTRFKVVQSRDGSNIRIVGYTEDKWCDISVF